MSEEGGHCRFVFDGQTIEAREGQTIAGALHDAGYDVLSRSFKYHRPRGLFCASGRCPNCLCTVDGEPSVRICTLKAKAGMQIKSQNRWPSLGFDVMAVFDRLHRLMPVGFYYKLMHKPRFLWPLFEKFIRKVAGLGHVDRAEGGKGHYDKLNLFTDVAVVGGGWSGLHAALEAADADVDVTLIDEQPALGGHMRHDPDLADSKLNKVIAAVESHKNINVIKSANVFGGYEQNLLGIRQGSRLIRLRASQVIVATGGWERPLVFENNDLPGNLLASGVQRLLHLDGCRFEGPALVVTDNPQGYRVAKQLADAGIKVAAIVDINSEQCAEAGSIPVDAGHTIIAARGRRRVTAAVIAPLDGGTQKIVSCRWIVQAVGFTPASSLLYQSGCKLHYDATRDQPCVDEYAEAVHSAGAVNGTHDINACANEGRYAAAIAARALTSNNDALEQRITQLDEQMQIHKQSHAAATAHYVSSSPAKKKFVCLCEDVTEKDIGDAIDEGYANIETLKRYSTISMGPCQGKMCQASAIALCARHTGRSIDETGTTTFRPPDQPVPLGVLAGRATHFGLVRRTAMHGWHLKAGATFLDAGAWKRPEHYGDPLTEYNAVRTSAGLIDVSTLGKIELRGADVVEFLEFIYPNRFAKLKVGRVRYGVVCDEAGIILDDGTIGRLADDRFFLTTTTGNADAIDGWFRWWLVCKPHLDVRLTNITAGHAAMNLAGPRSREILSTLCTADLSNSAMPYLAASQFQVAGVEALVLRIGFVGELGYEIHVPTQYGLHVWNAIMAAGAPFGIKPFGIEAQRILRLEKKHLLPGHDTDALSNPLEADLPWIIKLDKDDFIGRSSLQRAQQRGPQQRLVGFRIAGNNVPEEAALVVDNGTLSGRVTSARFSPIANATVGLAWVDVAHANNGDEIKIQLNGQTISAVIQDEPFYDPKGEKLRS